MGLSRPASEIFEDVCLLRRDFQGGEGFTKIGSRLILEIT